MDTLLLENCPSIDALVRHVHGSGMPAVVKDGMDECLVAMTPETFERILFDTAVLNLTDREVLRF